jgi:phosphoribosylamine-glycine ligase
VGSLGAPKIDGALLLEKARQYATSFMARHHINCPPHDLDDVIQDALEMTLRDFNPDYVSKKPGKKAGANILAVLGARVMRCAKAYANREDELVPFENIEDAFEMMMNGPPSQP